MLGETGEKSGVLVTWAWQNLSDCGKLKARACPGHRLAGRRQRGMENPDVIGGDWHGAQHHGWGTACTGRIQHRSSAPSCPPACLQTLSKWRILGSDKVPAPDVPAEPCAELAWSWSLGVSAGIACQSSTDGMWAPGGSAWDVQCKVLHK